MHCSQLISFGAASGMILGLAAASPTQVRTVNEVVTGQAAVTTINDNDGGAAKDAYTYYTGNGSTAAGWPAKIQWASFNNLWTANVPAMQESCVNNGWGADDSSTEISGIRTAIEQVANASGVDHRLILATIMQESKGCVRVITTGSAPLFNPGLMQSHNGTGTCVGQTPCPQPEIRQMIADGTRGTSSGAGLAALIDQAQSAIGDKDLGRTFYAAARLYNSGSVDYSNLDDGFSSTACYASDVANRLMGWVFATSTCTAT